MPTVLKTIGTEGTQGAGQSSATWPYLILSANDRADALTALIADADLTDGTYYANSYDVRELSPGNWEGNVGYGPFEGENIDPSNPNAVSQGFFEGDSGGESIKITTSLATPTTYEYQGGTATNYTGAIDPDDKGEPRGCDIVSRAFKFSVTKKMGTGVVTTARMMSWYTKSGTVNDGNFTITVRGVTLTFSQRELLLINVNYSFNPEQGVWDVRFNFSASPNVTLTIRKPGGTTGTIAKAGHDYFWARYGQKVDATTKRMRSFVLEAYTEQVYPESDFTGLIPDPA